jgi:hypothetical protein
MFELAFSQEEEQRQGERYSNCKDSDQHNPAVPNAEAATLDPDECEECHCGNEDVHAEECPPIRFANNSRTNIERFSPCCKSHGMNAA